MITSSVKGRSLFITCLLLIALQGCIVVENNYTKLPPGLWRGALELEAPLLEAGIDLLKEGLPPEENSGIYLPFLFEVKYDQASKMSIDIINGEERINLDHIDWGRTRSEAIDTFVIYFDVYDSYITGKYNEGIMQGKWVRNNRENYSIPFVAYFGEDDRFEKKTELPVTDLSGKWACLFEIEKESPYPAIAEFNQTDEIVLGTFRTEIGDYRYLEGVLYGNRLSLSVFDGAHAFLFKAKFVQDSLLGTFYSGNHYKSIWSGNRNEEFELTNPDSLTLLKPGSKFDFAFPDQHGNIKSLDDYPQAVKVVQILGTWCPNCRDETKFLIDYLNKNPDPNLTIIALAFESYRDQSRSLQAIQKYREHFKMDYDILLAGYRDKEEALNSLPMLTEIVSYPTLIFLDKENNVQKIHTGFNGPATSKYDEFVHDFDQTVQEMLQEAKTSSL